MSVATLALKEKLDSKQLLTLSTAFDKVKKSKTTAYLLWFFSRRARRAPLLCPQYTDGNLDGSHARRLRNLGAA